MKSAISAFMNGNLTVNEFTVYVAVQAKSDFTGTVIASATEISDSLRGALSRHAVARAIRNLQRDKWLTWETRGVNRISEIRVS
jgi:hypothetical protein